MKQYGVDRFEGDYAVLVDGDGRCLNVLRKELPSEIAEGDLVAFNDGEYRLLNEETVERKKEVSDLLDELFI